MTREKIQNHILAMVVGPEESAVVSSILLDTLQPPVAQRRQFVCELAWDLGCLVYEWPDGGYLFTPDTIDAEGFGRFCAAREAWEKAQRNTTVESQP
jgi:hypothetical protein